MAIAKEKQLWNLVKDKHEWSVPQTKLLQAIAIMIAEASRKPATARKKKDGPGLPFGPGDVHKRLLEGCEGHVNVKTYDKASFGRLGKTLLRVSDLELKDLDHLEGWLNAGGVGFWHELPTWNQVIKHIVDWIASAREWAGENAPATGQGSSVR